MKPITLNPVSVLAGLALAGVLAAASQSVTRVQPFPKETVRLVGEVPAEWWTFVTLRTAPDGTPIETYTVPSGHHFVVTAANVFYRVNADGQQVNTLLGVFSGNGNGTRVHFKPGTVLDVGPPSSPPESWAHLWGYLEPVQ